MKNIQKKHEKWGNLWKNRKTMKIMKNTKNKFTLK